jgi:ABC-type nitrate/sulfonate/bicarbonate transport system substrate-binding protein
VGNEDVVTEGGVVRNWLRIGVAVALLATLATAGAQGGSTAVAPGKLTIAYQPGLGYAPLILMKQEKTIEKRFPGTQVDWKVLASGTPITNGVIAGDIQIGAVGVGPMLVGWARGVNWKVIAPLNEGDLWLMAKDSDIKTIADLRGKKIATPTNTSIQAVTLRKMAEVKLGNAKALDSGLLAMDHPDGMQALLTGQIDAHFTSPPFQFQEKVRGAHIVARSYNYFGAHTFLVTVMTQKFYDEYPQFARAFYDSVVAMETLIKKNPDRVARILQQDAGGTPTNRQFKQWLVNPALTWTTRPRGLMRTATFMFRTQQIGKMPANWRELVFAPVFPTKGS